MNSFVSNLFHSESCFWDLSMLLNVSYSIHFNCWAVFHGYGMAIPWFVYPFTCWWRFGLFPILTIMSKVSMNIHVIDIIFRQIYFNIFLTIESIIGILYYYLFTFPVMWPVRISWEMRVLVRASVWHNHQLGHCAYFSSIYMASIRLSHCFHVINKNCITCSPLASSAF